MPGPIKGGTINLDGHKGEDGFLYGMDAKISQNGKYFSLNGSVWNGDGLADIKADYVDGAFRGTMEVAEDTSCDWKVVMERIK